ncbi:multicopper oxidase domain-containing protein [Corynebacterium halotolerans]|uniref:Copper-containing nitrite reductase n=1 Tax=Corynebacterium halotolerans YIM 70093 = DSM 44683 TaxID=1121362 RepID=M1P6C3_9CORY|nr:multicopper oxidase domain-containing protein [Corynebacterium halotolerans]AGF72221.1 major outer membrane protein [Corynebacterium halotolerans YIM 70093 = DSM 44683]
MTPPPGSPSGPGSADRTRGAWASWLLIGLAVAAVVVLSVALTPSTNTADGTTTASAGDGSVAAATAETVTHQVRIEGMAFIPAAVEVPAGTRLVLEITNDDELRHDLAINGQRSGDIPPGETVTFDAGVFGESAEGWCTIAGHKAMGMTFRVDVTGGDGGAMAGVDHTASAAGSPANPFVDVPTPAERQLDPGGDFLAHDPVLAPAPEGDVHEIELVMTEEVREVAPGHQQVQWLFNGTAPGPVLRGKVGDTFRVKLVNEGTMSHSVDFHAGEVSPDAAMSTIQPGESLVYEFTARRAGIWMYHCATAPMSLHIANGMAGAVVIDPPAGSQLALGGVDHEYLLVGHEVFLGQEDVGADAQRVSDGLYDLTAFNGHPNQYDHRPLEIGVGESARFWVLNAGPDNPLSFHIVGEIFDTVFTEGRYTIRDGLAQSTGAQVLPLVPAQAGFVEVTFDEPGTYTFVNHVMTDAEKGQHGRIVVE